MKDKKHLEGLVLKWGGDTSDSQKERDLVDKLQPHAGVKFVSIVNYGGTKFPHWLDKPHSFRNMVSLELRRCANCYLLPSIGQLPSLKHLRIEEMKEITEVGREFYEDASSFSFSSIKPFQSLETLSFEKMSEWKEWHALEVGEFSRLLELSIVDCPKLIGELPNHFPSLRKLEIFECHGLVSNNVGLLVQDISNLTELPPQFQNLSSLQKLKISRMPNLKELPPKLCRLIKLERLEIKKCPSLVSFPDMGLLPMLKTLEIGECEAL
ncbi:putative disease resistance RPP13-like protein 1 [Cornus florida]|uniref:putative disease resistance RPP13-like protein 1 n=1 Tax=Cornus florida TaxID=4283 RepID=UPI00289D5542|nr:putative disease resistance RPP13-like protein 1 [Cornus florida]